MSVSLSLSVRSTLLSSFENISKEFAIECIRACGLRHGFDVNEELEYLGLKSVKVDEVLPKKKEVKLDENGVAVKVGRKKKVLTEEEQKAKDEEKENKKKERAAQKKKEKEDAKASEAISVKSVVEEEKLTRIRVDGKQYLKNKNNELFDVSSREKVGIYNDGKIEA